MRWSDFPGIIECVREVFSDNGIPMKANEALTILVPNAYRSMAPRAEVATVFLKGQTLDQIIPDNQIDIELADPKDDALVTFCDGEDSIQKLLVENVIGADALAEILDQAFDGDLHDDFLDEGAMERRRERLKECGVLRRLSNR